MLSRKTRVRRWVQDRLQKAWGVDVTRASFYSPIVDRTEVSRRAAHVWSAEVQSPDLMPGIDFRRSHQAALLAGPLGQYMRDCRFPRVLPHGAPAAYFIDNGQFAEFDARMLVGVLRHYAPRRFIEVGSGFSTLVTSSVVSTHLAGATRITAIEPFPRPFLGELGNVELIERKVQDVELRVFEELEAGDVLFIDSSHVSKTGSDVNYLFFEVLPRLRPGVLIHIHDIWLPLEYPQEWVLTEARSWNEQYVLRALLTGSNTYQIELAGMYLCQFEKALLRETLGESVDGMGVGSGIWIRKTA